MPTSKYELINVIRRCQKGSLFDKELFLEMVSEMSEKEFYHFMEEIIELQQHRDNTVGLLATDKPEAIRDLKHLFFVIK